MPVVVVDVDGAVRAWVNSRTATLVGVGKPLPNGLHHGTRSPGQGAWGEIRGPSSRQLTDVADMPRVSIAVKAVGGKVDGGAYGAAERAARALALEIGERHGVGTVTTARGDVIRIIAFGDVQGPVYSGNEGGEETFVVDFVPVMQPG
jgi:hypothetical protein